MTILTSASSSKFGVVAGLLSRAGKDRRFSSRSHISLQHNKLRGWKTILALLSMLSALASFCCDIARADVDYAEIGWWKIRHRAVDALSGCLATAHFQDQTQIEMALIQQGSTKQWTIFISNPRWNSWISKRKHHTLFFAAVNPTRIWRDAWSVGENNVLYLNASVDFVNSIADANGLTILDDTKRPLTTSLLDMKDSEAAIKAVVNCVHEHPQSPTSTAGAQTEPQTTATSFSGTAFFVAPNVLLTNNHVVKECGKDIQIRYPDRSSYAATISAQDDANDLALLHTELSSQSVAAFRFRPRLGEAVATYGFPYSSLLSSSGNFTLGNVTSLSGIKDDSRFIQISTPVQPGNSGGPLLNTSGDVVGIIEGQLNAVTMMQVLNSVPQNVNFAIQAPIVVNFLSTRDVTPKMNSGDARRELPWSDIADLAKKFTVQVYCDAGTPKVIDTPKTSEAAPIARSVVPALEKQAKEFVLSLQAKWSSQNEEALSGLDAIYDDEVMYYGKKSTREDVIKEKRAFARKFPEREYKPKEPISVWCRERLCTVRGLVDFRAIDPVAKVMSEGAASFEYQLLLSGGTVKITVEAGEVLKRNKTPLSNVVVSPSRR